MTNLSTDMIVSLYLRAKDRDKEICVLAELTASDSETIMEVLKDAGVYSGAYKTCPRCGTRYPVLPHKYKRNSHCPECAKMKKQIDNHKQAIRRNLAKISELQRNNAEHKKMIDEIEEVFNEKNNGSKGHQ